MARAMIYVYPYLHGIYPPVHNTRHYICMVGVRLKDVYPYLHGIYPPMHGTRNYICMVGVRLKYRLLRNNVHWELNSGVSDSG